MSSFHDVMSSFHDVMSSEVETSNFTLLTIIPKFRYNPEIKQSFQSFSSISFV